LFILEVITVIFVLYHREERLF